MTANPFNLPLTDPFLDPNDPWVSTFAPGIVGRAYMDLRGVVVIHYIDAIDAKQRGQGHVGKFLDALAQSGGRYAIEACVNPTLEGMLIRRGWKCTWESVVSGPFKGDRVDMWWPPKPREKP